VAILGLISALMIWQLTAALPSKHTATRGLQHLQTLTGASRTGGLCLPYVVRWVTLLPVCSACATCPKQWQQQTLLWSLLKGS
jgi:hypothetical protein